MTYMNNYIIIIRFCQLRKQEGSSLVHLARNIFLFTKMKASSSELVTMNIQFILLILLYSRIFFLWTLICALALGEQADRLDFLSRVWSALLRGGWASSENDRELRVGHVSSRHLSPVWLFGSRVHQVPQNSCNNYQILCSYFGGIQ